MCDACKLAADSLVADVASASRRSIVLRAPRMRRLLEQEFRGVLSPRPALRTWRAGLWCLLRKGSVKPAYSLCAGWLRPLSGGYPSLEVIGIQNRLRNGAQAGAGKGSA